MLIIPAIDLLDGKAVHLQKGDFSTAKIYSEHPVDQAIIYDESGFEWVYIVDLLGAKDGNITTTGILEEIKEKTKLKIQFGGGIRSSEDILNLFSVGVDKLMIGSLPFVDRPEFEKVLREFPLDKIIIAADTKKGEVVEQGWKKNSSLEVSRYVNDCREYGLKNFLITDIDKDGMLEGPNVRLYKGLKEVHTDIFLYASGGVHAMSDIEQLDEINCDAVIVGKAIFENRIDMKDLIGFGK